MWTWWNFIFRNTRVFKALEPNKTGCVSIYSWMRRDHQVVNSRCPLQSRLHPLLHISACHMLALRAHYWEKKPKKEMFTWSSLRLRTIYCISWRCVNLLENQFHLCCNDSWDSQEGSTNFHRIIDFFFFFFHFIVPFWSPSLTDRRRGSGGDGNRLINQSVNSWFWRRNLVENLGRECETTQTLSRQMAISETSL